MNELTPNKSGFLHPIFYFDKKMSDIGLPPYNQFIISFPTTIEITNSCDFIMIKFQIFGFGVFYVSEKNDYK